MHCVGVQVNATGVMPVIFASTLMSLPTALGRNVAFLQPLAVQLSPTKPLFLPVSPLSDALCHRPSLPLPAALMPDLPHLSLPLHSSGPRQHELRKGASQWNGACL